MEQASKNAIDKTAEAYEKQYGQYDLSEDSINQRLEHVKVTGQTTIINSENDITGLIAASLQTQELLTEAQKDFDNALKDGSDTTWISGNVQRYIDMANELSGMLDTSLADLMEKQFALEEGYQNAIEKSKNAPATMTSTDHKAIQTYESIQDTIRMIQKYTDPNGWNQKAIADIFQIPGIEKTRDELVSLAAAGKLSPETIEGYKNLNAAIQDSKLILTDSQTAAKAFCEEIYGYAEAARKVEAENASISFGRKFENLWDTETFSNTRSELTRLAEESGITASEIQSLASENEDLAVLLEQSGMSAQFAAACFGKVCEGADGFSAITEDTLALDAALHSMDQSLKDAASSRSAYEDSLTAPDYNSEFRNYQEAYQSALEMIGNDEYGKHFRSTMEYLLGDGSYTMSIEEMKTALGDLQSIFGEESENGLGFLDQLYEHKEILDGLDSSMEKLSDGSFTFDIKPEDFEAVADALGMTTEEVSACINALGMFGDYSSYDLGQLEETLLGIAASSQGSGDAILSLQGVQNMLADLGYNGYEAYAILQDIQGMDSLKLLDFSATDADSVHMLVENLQDLEMLEINGDSINVESLAASLADTNLRLEFSTPPTTISSTAAQIGSVISRLPGTRNVPGLISNASSGEKAA